MKNKLKTLILTVGALISQLSLNAFAEDASTAAGEASNGTQQPPNMWLIVIVYVLFFVVVGYFLIVRPNKKRQKEEEQLKSSLVLGDEITTIGGICGKIINIKDDVITIETSIDRTLIEFKNWAIKEVKKPISDDDNKK